MYIVTVLFEIAKAYRSEFSQLMNANAKASVAAELGCIQFDVCGNAEPDQRVFLYEVYASKEAFDEHLKSAHFLSFNEATLHMVVSKKIETFSVFSAYQKAVAA